MVTIIVKVMAIDSRVCFSGSKRMARLNAAVVDGMDQPPVDLRYISTPCNSNGPKDAARSDVISFLASIYDSVAETLPDVRDSTFDDIVPDDVPCSGLVDNYSLELNRQTADTEPGSIPTEKKPQQEKPRKMKKSVKLNMDRGTDGKLAMPEKWLPPGCMKEYYMQYVLQSPLDKPAVFSTFWRVSSFEVKVFSVVFSEVVMRGRILFLSRGTLNVDQGMAERIFLHALQGAFPAQ